MQKYLTKYIILFLEQINIYFILIYVLLGYFLIILSENFSLHFIIFNRQWLNQSKLIEIVNLKNILVEFFLIFSAHFSYHNGINLDVIQSKISKILSTKALLFYFNILYLLFAVITLLFYRSMSFYKANGFQAHFYLPWQAMKCNYHISNPRSYKFLCRY